MVQNNGIISNSGASVIFITSKETSFKSKVTFNMTFIVTYYCLISPVTQTSFIFKTLLFMQCSIY